MSADELLTLVGAVGLPLAGLCYVLLLPDKAQKVAGWAWAGIARLFRTADKRAVALRVQGDINDATKVVRDAPDGVVDGKLKISWTDADEARAVLRDGDVVVFMRRSEHHEENVAQALMAYLPKAVLPRARRYLDRETMQAADLTLAKTVLASADGAPGALDVFFEKHLEPAQKSDVDMERRLVEMDEIDLHGWLLRMLIPEFAELGRQMYPGEPQRGCRADAEAFARWLYKLAARAPGDASVPRSYDGQFLRVAVVLVGDRRRLEEEGPEPYRKQAKTLVYSGQYDSIYLLGRDENISAVWTIYERLSDDGRVASHWFKKYRLRADFRKRKLPRDNAALACLRTRPPNSDDAEPDEDLPPVEVETPSGRVPVGV